MDWIEKKQKRKEKYKMMRNPSCAADRLERFFPVMCNIARPGRIQMGSCSGSGAVQQLAEERNGVMSQKAKLRWWLPGLSQHKEKTEAHQHSARARAQGPPK